jgi:transcriptional regulator with XRE-family HTH domain
MGIGVRIKAAREAKGWSQAELGKRVGAVQTTVSSWERERTEPTREDVQRIAHELDISPADLEFDAQSAGGRQARATHVVGYVGAGSQAHNYATGDDLNDYVAAPDDATPSTVAREIRGASLGPAFDHWLVFYDEIHDPVTPDQHGKLCVVGLETDQVLVKVLRATGTPGRYHLISNGGEEPIFDQHVLWAATVKLMRPR